MNKMSQKEAVFTAVSNVCEATDGVFTPTKDERASVNQILFDGFKKGTIEFAGNLPEDSKLKSYVSGLQSNWLRKDKRLNGGVQYVAKNPGSRAGSTDAQVKACRVLLATQEDPAKRAEIESFIAKRLAEIKPSRSTALTDEQKAVLEAAGLGHMIDS